MDPLHNLVEFQPLCPCKAEQRTPFVGGPDFVSREIANQNPETGSFNGQPHSFFNFVQPGFTLLQLAAKFGGVDRVTAQLVAHHCDQAHEGHGHHQWYPGDSPEHQHGLTCSEKCKEHGTAANGKCMMAVAPTPGSGGGICKKDEEDDEAQLAHQHTGVGHTLGNLDGLTEKGDRSETSDLEVVEVLPDQKI